MTDEWPPPTVSVLDGPRKHPIRVCAFGADVMFLTVEEAVALASDLGEAVGQIRNSEPLPGSAFRYPNEVPNDSQDS